MPINLKGLSSVSVYLGDLIVRCSERCGRGAVVLLFTVANDALKNKQIFTTDEEKTKPRPQRRPLSVLQYAVTV